MWLPLSIFTQFLTSLLCTMSYQARALWLHPNSASSACPVYRHHAGMINIYILFEFGGVSFVHILKWYYSEWLKTVATTPRCQIELARLLLLSQKFFSFPIFRIIVLDHCVRLNKFHRENHRYFRASKRGVL